MRTVATLSLLVLLMGCREPESLPDRVPLKALKAAYSPQARTYFESALDTLQEHSVFRDSTDWAEVRRESFRRAQGARKPADVYDAIRFAMRQTGEQRGFFLPPRPDSLQAQKRDSTESSQQNQRKSQFRMPDLQGELTAEGIGYVKLPRLRGALPRHGRLFADGVQSLIRQFDSDGACGWIVDLRGNVGGNMWPMIAGVGPLLGEGQVGAFVEPGSPPLRWRYESGKVLLDSSVQARTAQKPYPVQEEYEPVAVLTNRYTASSAEAIAVAFRGRPNTKTFGEATKGAATAPELFTLRNGAKMAVSTKCYADRTDAVYCRSIPPDEKVRDPRQEADKSDRVKEAAERWLAKQPRCREAS